MSMPGEVYYNEIIKAFGEDVLPENDTKIKQTFKEYEIQTENMSDEEIQEQIDEMMEDGK